MRSLGFAIALIAIVPITAIAADGGAPPPAPQAKKLPAWPRGCLTRFADPQDRAACLEAVAMDFGTLARYAADNRAVPPPAPAERRVVFFGDSITDLWSRPNNGGFFPGQPYLNRGISGQTTSQMLLRFRYDVIQLRPKAVVILAGTNDVAANSGPITVDGIVGNLASMAELASAHGIAVALGSLLPVCDCKADKAGKPIVRTTDRPPQTLRAVNQALAAYAKANGFVYLDYAPAMADQAGFLRPELTDDGLHPNAAGYAVMAPLAQKAIGQLLARSRRARAGAAAGRLPTRAGWAKW